MDRRPIGIFDSGLGGLTCVKEVMRVMPSESVIYFGDTGRVPYGTKSQDTLMKYVRQDIRFLEKFDIKMIIIACGTASSAALPWILDTAKMPIVGVVEPAAKAAVAASKTGRIGVLGTGTTVKYGKYVENIKKLCPEAFVVQKACPMFVPLVENGYAESLVARMIANEYLEEIKRADLDTVILGCTHYPLLKDVIKDILGSKVTLIDSGAAAADYALEKLKANDMMSDRTKSEYKYFVSDSADDFMRLGSKFLEKTIDASVEKIDIEEY